MENNINRYHGPDDQNPREPQRRSPDEETEEDYEGNGGAEDIIPDPEDFDEDYEDVDYIEDVDFEDDEG